MGALIAILVVALTVAILRPTTVVAAPVAVPSGSPTATTTASPTPQPTVTVFAAGGGASKAVRITSFTVGPNPIDCTDPAVSTPLHLRWTSVNGTTASLAVDTLTVAKNLPPSGDESDLPASLQPVSLGCQPPYALFKLTVVNAAGSATKIVTVVRKQ